MWGGEKIKLQKKIEIRAEKGQTKKVKLGWHRDRKENPITAPSIHVGALVGAASLWPDLTNRKQIGRQLGCKQGLELGMTLWN